MFLDRISLNVWSGAYTIHSRGSQRKSFHVSTDKFLYLWKLMTSFLMGDSEGIDWMSFLISLNIQGLD